MNVNSPNARKLMALAATEIRKRADMDPTALKIADCLEAEVEESLDGDPIWREFRIEQDYNRKRAGEPDNWAWGDAGVRLPDEYEAARDYARNFVETRHESRFVRGYRLVEKFSSRASRVLDTLSEKRS